MCNKCGPISDEVSEAGLKENGGGKRLKSYRLQGNLPRSRLEKRVSVNSKLAHLRSLAGGL